MKRNRKQHVDKGTEIVLSTRGIVALLVFMVLIYLMDKSPSIIKLISYVKSVDCVRTREDGVMTAHCKIKHQDFKEVIRVNCGNLHNGFHCKIQVSDNFNSPINLKDFEND